MQQSNTKSRRERLSRISLCCLSCLTLIRPPEASRYGTKSRRGWAAMAHCGLTFKKVSPSSEPLDVRYTALYPISWSI